MQSRARLKNIFSCGSRISHWSREGADPLGSGADLQHGHFSVETCENERIGSRAGGTPPPGSTTDFGHTFAIY